MTQEKQWTTVDLAKAANVDPSYIRHLLLDGKLQGQKLGRDWIIPDNEAQKFLNRKK